MSQSYTWKELVEKLYIDISKLLFDKEFVKEVYGIESWEMWKDLYDKGYDILPYRFSVPKEFRLDAYKTAKKIKSKNPHIVYIKWLKDGKDPDYIGRHAASDSINSIDFETFNVSKFDIFNVFNIFSEIYSNNKLEEKLHHLDIVANNNPNIKINDILDKYFELTK